MSDADLPPFTAMIRPALSGQLNDTSMFVQMISEDVRIEYPYASDEPVRIQGRSAMRADLSGISSIFIIDSADILHRYKCKVRTMIIDFILAERWLVNNQTFKAIDQSIIETRSGEIVTYQEYWNPLPAVPPSD